MPIIHPRNMRGVDPALKLRAYTTYALPAGNGVLGFGEEEAIDATAAPVTIDGSTTISGAAATGSAPAPATISGSLAISGTAQAGAAPAPATIAPAVVVIGFVPDQPPSVPTGLTATAVRETEADLVWDPSTDDVAVAFYEVTVVMV